MVVLSEASSRCPLLPQRLPLSALWQHGAMAVDISQVIDLERYPIHVDGEARRQLVADVQKDVRSVGCAVIKQFVKPEAIPALVAEGDRVSHLGHRNFNRTNPYFTQ